jgi:hypothetical protein
MRAATHPAVLVLLAVLLLPQRAARAEAGISLYTQLPLLVGLEASIGSHRFWELAVSGGITPSPYVAIIQEFAQDAQGSDVIEGTLENALGAQVQLRIFPIRGVGFFIAGGYDLLLVEGEVQAPAGSTSQALEEPDTGSDLPPSERNSPQSGFDPTDPTKPPDGGSELPPLQPRKEAVTSVVHAVHGALGYRHHLGRFYLQAELALLKAVSASSTPDELDGYLESIYTENLLVPLLGLSGGICF